MKIELCECGEEKYTNCDNCGCKLCVDCMIKSEYYEGYYCEDCLPSDPSDNTREGTDEQEHPWRY